MVNTDKSQQTPIYYNRNVIPNNEYIYSHDSDGISKSKKYLSTSGEPKISYGPHSEFGDGSEVQFSLDLVKYPGTFTVAVDDHIRNGMVYDISRRVAIREDIRYKMVVKLVEKGDEVTLIDYTCFYPEGNPDRRAIHNL